MKLVVKVDGFQPSSRKLIIQFNSIQISSLQIRGTRSLYPPKRSLGGVYWIHPVRPSVRLSVCLSVRPSVGRCPDDNSNSFQWIKNFFFYIYHLGQDLAWNWISASYLIKYAHTGRSCDLLIFGIPEVNFLVRAFQFGMKGVLSRIYDISPGFCWILIFVFFLNFLRVS